MNRIFNNQLYSDQITRQKRCLNIAETFKLFSCHEILTKFNLLFLLFYELYFHTHLPTKNGFNSIYIMILEAAVDQVYIENIKQ